MQVAPSLFDPAGRSVFGAAMEWMTGTLLGNVAVSLCVLAVAFVGLMLMSGRLAIRDGLRVAVGCFVLLGAATIAAGLRGAADEASSGRPDPVVVPTMEAVPVAPPSDDRYAGASLRRD